MSQRTPKENRASALIKRFNDLALLQEHTKATTAQAKKTDSILPNFTNINGLPEKSLSPDFNPQTILKSGTSKQNDSILRPESAKIENGDSSFEFFKTNSSEISLLLNQNSQHGNNVNQLNSKLSTFARADYAIHAKNRFPEINQPNEHKSSLVQVPKMEESSRIQRSFVESPKFYKLRDKIRANLTKEAEIDNKTSALTKSWMLIAANCYTKASELQREKKLEESYIMYLRLCNIALEILPKKPDFKEYNSTAEYKSLIKKSNAALATMDLLLDEIAQSQVAGNINSARLSSSEKVNHLIDDFRNRFPSIRNGLSSSFIEEKSLHSNNYSPISSISAKTKSLSALDEISPEALYKLIKNGKAQKAHHIVVFDIRSPHLFNTCHLNFQDTVNINPDWITNSSVFNYILYKLGTASKEQQDLFLEIDSSKTVVYIDERNYHKDQLDDIASYQAKYELMHTMFNNLDNFDSPNLKPGSFLLLKGNLLGLMSSHGNSVFIGSNVNYYNHAPMSKLTTLNNKQDTDLNTTGSLIRQINKGSNTALSRNGSRKSNPDKRSGAIIPKPAAEIVAKTVETGDVSNENYLVNRSLYEFYTKPKNVNNTSSNSVSTSPETHASQKRQIDQTFLNKNNQGSQNGTVDPPHVSATTNDKSSNNNASNSSNSDLYFVIGRKSESIKKALKNDTYMDESHPVDKILRRKTIFDDFLLGFTNNKNAQLSEIGVKHTQLLEQKQAQEVTSHHQTFSSLQSPPKLQDTVSRDIAVATGPTSITQHDVVLPPKPLELMNDRFVINQLQNTPATNQTPVSSPYLKPLPQAPIRSKLSTGQQDIIYRSSSSGPQSSMLEVNRNAPPGPPITTESSLTNASIQTYYNSGAVASSRTAFDSVKPISNFVPVNFNALDSYQTLSPMPTRSRTNITLTGLKNFGNTCYINSVIQVLFGTLPFARFFLAGLWKRDAGISRRLMGFDVKKTGPKSFSLISLTPESARSINHRQKLEYLTTEFSIVIDQLSNDQFTVLSPQAFVSAVRKCIPAFEDNNQHDSQEFASYLLDNIHECLNTAEGKPKLLSNTKPLAEREKKVLKLQEIENDKRFELLSDLQQSELKWNEYTSLNRSIVTSIFQGQLQSRLVCAKCAHKSTTYSTFNELSVPIPLPGQKNSSSGDGIFRDMNKLTLSRTKPKASIHSYHNNFSNLTVSLSDCISKFVEPEVLDVDNEWFCPSCNKKSSATKTLRISKLPLVLMVHLKRFSYEGPFRDKLETMVNYPISNLDMSPYLVPSTPETHQSSSQKSSGNSPDNSYHLYGVVNHMGTLSGGHYTASVYNGYRNEWNYFNDTRVSQIKESEIVSPAAYLLFFVRNQS